MSARCPDCGTSQRPNPLPWLLLPVLLGGAAAAFLLLWGDRFGLGGAVLIVTLPFAAFLLALKQATAAWVAEAIASTGATSAAEIGRVMGALMKAHRGDMDGKLANRLVREALA